MFDSVRTRLTLWYAGVLALSLIASAFVIYYATARIFHERQDETLRSTAQTVASAYVEEIAEQDSAGKAGEVVLAELAFPNRYVQVLDNNGRTLAATRNLADLAIPISAAALSQARERGLSLITVNGLRVAIVPFSTERDLGFAAVAEPLGAIDEGLRSLRHYFYAGVPLILLLASAGGYFLARKSLSRIALMNRQTRRITAENLSARLDVTAQQDELGELATTINDLLTRLETSFKEQQRFIADASHELRTPLAVLRGETEVALTQTRGVDEYRESLTLIKDESERLSRLVEDLFVLARQPIDRPAKLLSESVSLNQLAADCARAAQVLAAQKNLRLNFANGSGPLTLRGDGELLKRMLLNLLDNAVKYTPPGGEIGLTLTTKKGNARLTVDDTGIGIPAEEQAKIFDRFYRVDKARSRALGGAGLGLAIARWIVTAHAGEIHVESAPGKGSSFTVELPLQN
ncbi:MAG TPA: ATP-binding protein [Pyrinomonadaceae bacterium]|nr:ATP-binding protein [Pyrinomonadaceae bacterium]